MSKTMVYPSPGRKVRKPDGRHLPETGEAVVFDSYYRRRELAGDIITDRPDLLKVAIMALEPNNPDHWTASGLPDLTHLKSVLGRSVKRAEVTSALSTLESIHAHQLQ